MAEKPYKINDRRGIATWGDTFRHQVLNFVDAAKLSIQREHFLDANKDASALLNPTDRKRMLTVGRTLYARDPVVQGCLNQMADLATATVHPQSESEDIAWGEAAEAWLYENDRWIDVEGPPRTMSTIDRLIVLSVIRDGDVGVLLTENAEGDSRIQLIPGHRIGCRDYSGAPAVVKGGPFDGASICDGVILGPSNEAIGYRVLGATEKEDKDYRIKDFHLIFRPFYVGQHRGFSWLGAAAIGLQDAHESRRLQLMKQKKVAGKSVIEHNESGGPPLGDVEIITEGSEATSTAAATTPVYGESIRAGEVSYFRAGSNSKLEVLESNTPTTNEQEFTADIIRQAVHAIGWSVDFWLKPNSTGGAMRVVVSGINQTLDMLRRDIICHVRKWVDPWRIARAINSGRLPSNPDWWRWEYQFAARQTADAKYDSDVSINELNRGIRTQQQVCAERGIWWQDAARQKARELEEQLTHAKAISAKFGISIQEAMANLGLVHSMQFLTANAAIVNEGKQDSGTGGNDQ